MRGVYGHYEARPLTDTTPSTALPWSLPYQVSTGSGVPNLCQSEVTPGEVIKNMGLKGDAEKAALPGECGGLGASLTWTLLEERSINLGTQRCGRRVS